MNDVLQKSLSEILIKATEAVSVGVSFLSAQLPDVVRQLLLYKLAWNSFTALLGIVIIALILVVFFKWVVPGVKKEEAKNYGHSENYDIPFVFAGIPSLIFGSWLALSSLKTVLMVSLAPKIYLIEYAASLISK